MRLRQTLKDAFPEAQEHQRVDGVGLLLLLLLSLLLLLISNITVFIITIITIAITILTIIITTVIMAWCLGFGFVRFFAQGTW